MLSSHKNEVYDVWGSQPGQQAALTIKNIYKKIFIWYIFKTV